MRRRLAVIVIVLTSACGGSPAAPSPPLPFSGRVALGDGRRLLTIMGDSFKCGDVRLPQAGTSVVVDVMGATEGMGWTLRPLDASGGSFEIHIERMLKSGVLGSVPLSGSARGYAIDSSREFTPTPTGTTLTFSESSSGPISFTGQMPFGSLATGEFLSAITFSRNGATASCPPGAATWSLTNSSQQ